MGKHRSNEEIAAAVEQYVAGRTVAEVAESIGVGHNTVRKWLHAADVPFRRTRVTKRQRKQAVKKDTALRDLTMSGDSLTVVAARYGIPRSTLARWSIADEDDLAYKGEWIRVGAILRGSARDVA